MAWHGTQNRNIDMTLTNRGYRGNNNWPGAYTMKPV